MFRTFCGIVWNLPFFGLFLLLLLAAGIVFAGTAVFAHGTARRAALRIAGIAFVCAIGLAVGPELLSELPQCRAGRVVREQISHEYVSTHFDCDSDARTLRGISRNVAEQALARCDEDHWTVVATLKDDRVAHEVMLCRPEPGIELWADQFTRLGGQHDWDVCFTACRPGACRPETIVTGNTE